MTSIGKSKSKTAKKTTKKAAKKAVKKATKKAAEKATKKATKKVAVKATKAKTAKKKSVASKSKSPAKKSVKAAKGMPVVGQAAPNFVMKTDTSGVISLEKYRGKNVVLYFYPKDDTPGCTIEACSFQENKNRLMTAGAVVIGVSPDSVDSHAKFRKKYGLDFVLAADEDTKVAKAYGVWVEKNMYGKKKMGIQRATFLIDGSGRVAYVWPKVAVEGHTQEVLDQLNRL